MSAFVRSSGAGVMLPVVARWILIVLAAWMTLELSGLRAVFAGECDEGCLSACDDEDQGCDPCACCPIARSDGQTTIVELPIPLERPSSPVERIAFTPEPEPREILHVPIV